MKKYTLGLIFDQSLSQILLMHKTKPAFQVGKLNGLGGKIEEGETPEACIAREVREESGLNIKPAAWVRIGTTGGTNWTMEVFAHRYLGNLSDAKSLEAEQIEWFHINQLPTTVLTNIPWMIAFAVETFRSLPGQTFFVDVGNELAT